MSVSEIVRFDAETVASSLHPDRFFDPEPSVRRIARAIYERTHGLPLICPHGHVDPSLLADNAQFPEPTALLIAPDHYLVRMLYSRGVSMESLGIPTRDDTPVEADPRKVWQLFADHFYLFRGTPSGAWLAQEFVEVFGVPAVLTSANAMLVYDEIAEKLTSPEFRPRALFDRFNIEVLATTDKASDPLLAHQAMRSSGWHGRVVPTFRPDAAFRIASPDWTGELTALSSVTGVSITDFTSLLRALRAARRHFIALGATASDHAVVEPWTEWLSADVAQQLFARAQRGDATVDDQRRFEGHMLMEMAQMSITDGLVMQLHPGSLRDHDASIAARFGPDRGGDIPLRTEYTRNLRALLNKFGHDPRFTLILFTLDESTYARELAPLAGLYPALRLGPAWWFHDSIEGMTRFRHAVTETAGFYNTAGFNDDTRAFCSIPARHDLSRRVDANFLAGLVARHQLSLSDAHDVARALAYELAKSTYRFDAPSTVSLFAHAPKGHE